MNYIGSKLSLLSFIEETIDCVNKCDEKKDLIFADLFAGTGVVGAKFKEKNYKVISNDIQFYSYVFNKYLIESKENISDELVSYLNSLDGVEGFIYNNYCMGSGSKRNYFSDYNGKKCDAIRQEIEKLYKKREITEDQYYRLLASLIESIDKYANTASVYGAFLKNIKASAMRTFEFRLLPLIDGRKDGEVYNENISFLIENIKGDILYLDPPYNSRQYASNYHILETIARYDDPKISGKTGLRDYVYQKSDFCSKRKIQEVFENLIKNVQFEHIFLSYNNEGLMNFQYIKEIMSRYGDYKVFKKKHRRFKADKEENRDYKAESTIEYLHYLHKRRV